MTVHPAVVARYREIRRRHRSIGVPGELTAARQIEALDEHGLLSLAEEVGAERVRGVIEREFTGLMTEREK